jgi:hypothetical protein
MTQTVGQLKEWLKGLPDDHAIWGAFQGQPRVKGVHCRHAEGRVIIEVPRLESQS